MNNSRLSNLNKSIQHCVCASWTVTWLLLAQPAPVPGQFTYTVLHDFTESANDGGAPRAGLLVSDSRLYGTTGLGGSNSLGTVFALNTDGSGYAAIYGFSSAEERLPVGRLVLFGSALYGTAPGAVPQNRGTVFSLNLDGSAFRVLKYFTNAFDGLSPAGTLVHAETTFFGTGRAGGSNSQGIAFKVNHDGSGYTVLRNFGGADGANPWGGLLLAGTTLYGTAIGGGTNNCGTVFRLNVDGSDYTVLKSFGGADGKSPVASLAMSGGVLYGTTLNGGAYSNGTVFRISLDGTGFAVLKHFNGSDGANPYADLVLVGANLYGTTSSGGVSNVGTVFQLSTDGTTFTVIKHFSGSDGANPYGGLALSGTSFYGTTGAGGAFNYGVVFSLALQVPPTILKPPTTQTAEAGSRVQLSVEASGSPPLAYQWSFNGADLITGTSSTLELPSIALADAGIYAVVVSNSFGVVTSAPAMLQVIPPVERRLVPVIQLMGEASSLLNVDYANSIAAAPNWLSLDTVSLINTSQLYFDVTVPLATQRFYRAWQTGAPVVRPSLNLPGMVPALTLTGAIGSSVRLDYINQVGPIDAWVTNLATVTLTNTSQLYFDTSVIGQPPRLWRLVPVP